MNPALIPSLLVGAAVLLGLLAVLACIGVRSRPDDETVDLDEPERRAPEWVNESRSRGGRP